MLNTIIKRCFDIMMSVMALLFIGPILLATALIIKLNSNGPIIYSQKRVGRGDKEFVMYKFRTMYVGTPEVATDKLKDSDSYITSVGYYLRKYSIDELPQLLNILLGDMSIVGPRPALYNQYDLREMRNVAEVSKIRPGLTGWAQVNGRDELTLEQKVALDSHYLQHCSFTFDLQIIYRTIFSICSGDGVQSGQAIRSRCDVNPPNR